MPNWIRLKRLISLWCIKGTGCLKRLRFMILPLAVLFTLNSIAVDAHPGAGEMGNVAPTISLSVTPAKKPLDIVILTDYTGTNRAALDAQINALKANFNAVNVNPVVHVVSSMKKVGTQTDELYMYRRYARLKYQIHRYEVYTMSSSWNYYNNYDMEVSLLWEELPWLMSEYASMPKRIPTNVSYSKSPLINYVSSTGNVKRDYWNVTVTCSNDVRTSGTVEQELKYVSNTSERRWDYLNSESFKIDSSFTREEKIANVIYDVMSFDFSQLNTLPLRTGSDRHMIFLSDSAGKNYGAGIGNYFSFGDMTATVKDYIAANSFSLYGVMPNEARDMTLLPDKVSSILPFGNTSLFYMRNGDVLQLGDPALAATVPYGSKMYPKKVSDIGSVKEVINTTGLTYWLMNDGTIKYVPTGTNTITTLLSGITKVFTTNSNKFYAINSSGQAFQIYDSTVVPFNNPFFCDKVVVAGYNEVLIASDGTPYGEYSVYNSQYKTTTYGWAQVMTYSRSNGAVGYLGAVKDIKSVNPSGGSLFPIAVHSQGDWVRQFEGTTTHSVVSGKNTYRYLALMYEPAYYIDTTDVDRIDKNGNTDILIYYKNGAVKSLAPNLRLVHDREEGDYYVVDFRNYLVTVPVTNIQKTVNAYPNKVFMTDSNNNTYMYDGYSTTNMGNIKSVNSCRREFANSKIYLLKTDGTVRELVHYNNSLVSDTILPYNDIDNVYTSTINAYLVNKKGYVYGTGNSQFGQLGYRDPSQYATTFVNPLPSTISLLDTTKSYVSLLDLFNEITEAEFYPVGRYTDAFSDIYDEYDDFSGSGNRYVLLGEDIEYQSVYSDYESDPEHSRQWRIAHDPYYFDNSMGVSQYHNPTGFTTNPPVKLDKAGKYTINLKARDNPKADDRFDGYRKWSLGDQNLTVYIHRKPIALQKLTITDNSNGTYHVQAFDAGSYDPDHCISRADKGITAREWRWREKTETTWHYEQMNKTDCAPDKEYFLQLRVQDIEGVWSDYNTIHIDEANPPIAVFSVEKDLISISDTLKVQDQSFPQSLSTINQWHWIIKKVNSDGSLQAGFVQNAQFANSNAGTGALTGYDCNVKTDYSSNGVGTYRIYLRVRDSNLRWSDGGTDSTSTLNYFYYRDITVDRPPTAQFAITNSPMRSNDLMKLQDQSTSTGLSPIVRWHWIVKKLNPDGSVPSANLQSEQFTDSNSGTDDLAGYDGNVKTDFSSNGTGTYRVYLRVKNGNGMWSDGGTDTAYTLNSFCTRDLVVDTPPTAQFIITNSPMNLTDVLKVRDTSYVTGGSPINRWHWIVKKLSSGGTVPEANLQDTQFEDSNNGAGNLDGYDGNVKADYNSDGAGTYRIYLRVRNSSDMWSDGGTDASVSLGGCCSQDLIVQDSFKLANFRVTMVRDFHLESYYKNPATGTYEEKPISVSQMALDSQNYNGLVSALTKGYRFEFKIDSMNFNEAADTIVLEPHFYTCSLFSRDSEERDLYWENSLHEVLKAGEGGHSRWAEVILTQQDRLIADEQHATWSGSYLIPATAWAVPHGTSPDHAKAFNLKQDIIVSFDIKGCKNGEEAYNYNLQQWPLERTAAKHPYEVGDVIRYAWDKGCLDDIRVYINRP